MESDSIVEMLDLTRQQRNLLLLRPLFQLELNKTRIGAESNGDQGLFDGVDTHYLVLSVLDFMMEGTTIHMGCTKDEVLNHLAQISLEMKKTLTAALADRIAEVVMDTLDNKSNAYREFAFDYFDAPTGKTKAMRFRLVTYEPDMEDVYRYRPTAEGYLVYLGMLDLSPEDSQELMEKMLDLLVQRGRFDTALEIAKRARKLSIEYRQHIRDRLFQAYRSPGSVNWTREMAGKLDSARDHVHGRQAEDQRMEESVREALLSAEDPKTRQDLAQLLKTLQSAGLMRSKLSNDIAGASDKFIEAQRAVFRARRPSGLPDLETKLLPQLLGLPTPTLAEQSDDCISAFYPADWPKVFDLNSVFSILLERRAEDIQPEQDDGEITPFKPPEEQFPRTLIDRVEHWLIASFDDGGTYSVEDLLRRAQVQGESPDMQRCMALMLYRSFAQSESVFQNVQASVSGRFKLEIAQGTNIVFSPVETPE